MPPQDDGRGFFGELGQFGRGAFERFAVTPALGISRLVPGRGPTEAALERLQRNVAPDPDSLGGVIGRVTGEAASFLVPGAALGKIGKLSKLPTLTRSLIAGAPADLAIGAGLTPEESFAGILNLPEGVQASPLGRGITEATIGGTAGLLGESVFRVFRSGDEVLTSSSAVGEAARKQRFTASATEAATRFAGRGEETIANTDIAQELLRKADEFAAEGEFFRRNAMLDAARNVQLFPMPLTRFRARGGALEDLPGIGPGVAARLEESIETLTARATSLDPEVRAAAYLENIGRGFGRELEIPEPVQQGVSALFRAADIQAANLMELGVDSNTAIQASMRAILPDLVDTEVAVRSLMGDFPEAFTGGRLTEEVSDAFLRLRDTVASDTPTLSIVRKLATTDAGQTLRNTLEEADAVQIEELFLKGWRGWLEGPNQLKRAKSAGASVANFYRAALISLPQTAIRNAIMGISRVPEGVMEATLGNAVRAARGEIPWHRVVRSGVQSSFEALGALRSDVREQYLRLFAELDADQLDRLAKNTLVDIDLGEAGVMGRVVRALSFFNRAQEGPVREINAIARFMDRAVSEGVDPDVLKALRRGEINLEDVPDLHDTLLRAQEDAVKQALDATVALEWSEMGPIAQTFGKVLNAFPEPISAFIHPFGRAAANLSRYFWLRTFHQLRPSTWRRMAQGGVEGSREIARLMEGALFMGLALKFRSSDLAGPKWYQVRTGRTDENDNPVFLDTRAYQPFAAFLFLAENLRNMAGEQTNLDGSDLAEAVGGVRRFAASPAGVFLGLAEGRYDTMEQAHASITRALQGVLSSLTRNPIFGIAATIEAEMDPEAGAFRDLRQPVDVVGVQTNVFNEAIANIPFVGSRVLPASPSGVSANLRGATAFPGQALLRTAGGVSTSTESPVESEARRLGVRHFTSTGIPELDRATDLLTGPTIERQNLDALVHSDFYQRLPDEAPPGLPSKRGILSQRIQDARNRAKQFALQQNFSDILDSVLNRIEGMDVNEAAAQVDNLQVGQHFKRVVLFQHRARTRRLNRPMPGTARIRQQ